MASADRPTQDIGVPWDRLRTWVGEHETFEREHQCPAMLSRAQLEAISLLIPFVGREPDVSDRDYVSALTMKMQALALPLPVFQDLEPINLPVNGHFQPLWRTVCSIAGHGSFPREVYGVEAGQQAPIFQSKKNSKRYAAKCALRYVLDSPITSTSSFCPAKRTAAALAPSAITQSPARKVARDKSPQPQPETREDSLTSSRSGKPDNDEGSSLFQQVSTLATRLGVDGPRYNIEPEDDPPNFFRGRPVFVHGGLVPPGLGVVSGVLGKRQAKIQIAEQVLEWLEEELRNRDTTFNSLFAKGH